MRFSTLHKLIAYLMAGLGLTALSLGLELGIGTLAWIVVGFVASFFAEEPLLSKPAYAKLWTRATVAIFVLQFARGFLGAAILPLGVEFAAFLQLSRLGYRRSAREYQQIAILAFLHLVAATVLTTGIDYAVVFFGFVIVTPWMLALTHLRTEIESNYGGDGSERAVADVRRVLRSRRVAGPGFLFGTAILALPLFVVTAAFFLLFPRVGMGFLSFSQNNGRAVAGFGRNVELGRFGVIRDDPTVVLRVTVPDAGEPPPAELGLRLRGTSFDHYEGGSWTRSATGAGERIRPDFGFYDVDPSSRGTADRQLNIILDPIDEPVLFLPAGTVGLTISPRLEGGREVEREVIRSHGTDLRYGGLDGLELIYTAHVSSAARFAVTEHVDADTIARNLQLPPGQEQIAALARSQLEGAVTDHDKARLLTRWLRGSGQYDYSLAQPDTTGQDPLHVFLFDAHSGHCEYFSTALAVMLRTQGVPARNVTGFVGGSYNAYGDYYAVRQGDAHSWVEAYVDGGWVTFDPTPSVRDALGPQQGPFAALSELLDALRVRWSQHIVGYDLRRQATAVRDLLDWLAEMRAEEAEERVAEAPARDSESEAPRHVPWGFLGGAALTLLVAYGILWFSRRRKKAGPAERASDREALRLYLRLERALAKAGRARRSDQTPLAHIDALAAEGFPGAAAAAEITEAYVACRFGGQLISTAELRRLRARVREVGRPEVS